jgi:hypothetical protein
MKKVAVIILLLLPAIFLLTQSNSTSDKAEVTSVDAAPRDGSGHSPSVASDRSASELVKIEN